MKTGNKTPIKTVGRLTKDFLLSQGWEMVLGMPLFTDFKHKSNLDLVCRIGMYGEFYITELHWCNKTSERIFSTINSNLTTDDYFKILSLLRINI